MSNKGHLKHAVCVVVGFMALAYFVVRDIEEDVFVFVGTNLTRPFDKVAVAAIKTKLDQSMPKGRDWRLDEYYLEDYTIDDKREKVEKKDRKTDPAALYQAIGGPSRSKPLFVFDNLKGSDLERAVPKIDEFQLDVIALNGDRYVPGGRVIYLDPDNFSRDPVIDYATKVLALQSDFTNASFVCIGEVQKDGRKYIGSADTHRLLKQRLEDRASSFAEVWAQEGLYEDDKKANKNRALEALDKELEEQALRLTEMQKKPAREHSGNLDAKQEAPVKFNSKTIYFISVHGSFGGKIIEHLAEKNKECIYLGPKHIISDVTPELIQKIRAEKNRLILLQRPFDRISGDDRDLLRQLQMDGDTEKSVRKSSPERTLINCERANLAWLLIESHVTDRTKQKPYDVIKSGFTDNSQISSLIRKETLLKFDANMLRIKEPIFGEYRLNRDRENSFHFISCEYQLPKDYVAETQQPSKDGVAEAQQPPKDGAAETQRFPKNSEKDLLYTSNIFASLDINSIKSVQESLNTFTADINVAFLIRIDQYDCSKIQGLFPDVQVVWDGARHAFLTGDTTSTTVKDVAMPPWAYFSNADVVNSGNGRASIVGSFLRIEYPVSGTFFADYKMREFPFDNQTLEVRLRARREFHLSMESISEGVAAIFGSHASKGSSSIINGWHLLDSESDVRERTVKFRTDFAEFKDRPDIQGTQEIVSAVKVGREQSWGWTRIIVPYLFIGIGIAVLTCLGTKFLSQSRETSLALFLAVLSLAVSHLATAPQVNTVTKADFMYLTVFIGGLLNFCLTTLYHSQLLDASTGESVWSKAFRVLIIGCIVAGIVPIIASLWPGHYTPHSAF